MRDRRFFMFTDEKDQWLETLEKSAEDLLWRIYQVKTALNNHDRDDAEAHLLEEALALREQSGQLEHFWPQPWVYLGG
jgi:hypothetical protein